MSDIVERHVLMTCDREHEDAVGPLYYFKLYDRMPGPYKTQLHRKAIIDVASDGTLAGVELIDDMPPPPRPADPPSTIAELFGERCADYDPDCATCFAHKQQDEILRLRAENGILRAALEYITDENCPDVALKGRVLAARAAALKETGE